MMMLSFPMTWYSCNEERRTGHLTKKSAERHVMEKSSVFGAHCVSHDTSELKWCSIKINSILERLLNRDVKLERIVH